MRYISTAEEYKQGLDLLQDSAELALDSETYVLRQHRNLVQATALDPHMGRISLLQLKGRQTDPCIFDILLLEREGYDPQGLVDLLLSRKKLIGHNISFDFKFIKRHYGVIPTNGFDTRMMAKLISNATGSKFARLCGHTLKDLCRDYLGIHLSGKGNLQTTDWYPRPTDKASQAYWQKKLEYAAADINYLFDLHDLFLEVLTRPLPYSPLLVEDEIPCAPPGSTDYGLGMSQLLTLEMFQTAVTAEMEYNGLPASQELLQQIEEVIYDPETDEGIRTEKSTELCDALGLETSETFFSDMRVPTERSLKALNNPITLKQLVTKAIAVNMDSSQTHYIQRLIDLLSEHSDGESMSFVDEDEADRFRDILVLSESDAIQSSQLCKLVLEYKQFSKLYSMGLSRFINPVTGCIHCGIDMLGAATGRSSSSAPNLQQVSARTDIKIDRPLSNLFPSSTNYDALIPDWTPNGGLFKRSGG